MKTTIAVAAVSLALFTQAQAQSTTGAPIPVTAENSIRAESDMYTQLRSCQPEEGKKVRDALLVLGSTIRDFKQRSAQGTKSIRCAI